MAREETEPVPDDRVVLLLRPVAAAVYNAVGARFRLLKAYESPVPLPEFLALHAGAARALLISGVTIIDSDVLDAIPSLELIVTTSAGLNHVDLPACASRGVAVANAGEVFSKDGADYAVGMLIDVLRRVSAADRYVRRGMWPGSGEYPLGSKLGGRQVGIVGLGSIGSEVAKRLESFGCIISYFARKKKLSVSYAYFSKVIDLAAQSSVLVVCCALTRETHHIINKDVMEALGKDGIIINVGRGALIDEKELVRLLLEQQIGGAGLDVFEEEPRVPKELFQMDNVVLSPHRAVFTAEAFSDLSQLIVDNLEAYFSNRHLLSLVAE